MPRFMTDEPAEEFPQYDGMVQLLATDLVELEADLYHTRTALQETREENARLKSLLEGRAMATEQKDKPGDEKKQGEGKPSERKPEHEPAKPPPSSSPGGVGHPGRRP